MNSVLEHSEMIIIDGNKLPLHCIIDRTATDSACGSGAFLTDTKKAGDIG